MVFSSIKSGLLKSRPLKMSDELKEKNISQLKAKDTYPLGLVQKGKDHRSYFTFHEMKFLAQAKAEFVRALSSIFPGTLTVFLVAFLHLPIALEFECEEI